MKASVFVSLLLVLTLSSAQDLPSTLSPTLSNDFEHSNQTDTSEENEFNMPLAIILSAQILQLVFQILMGVKAGSFGTPPAICGRVDQKSLDLGAEILKKLEETLKENKDKDLKIQQLLSKLLDAGGHGLKEVTVK